MNKISAILAMSKDGVIGDRDTNDLPWKLPNDLKWFKQKTLNQIIIMGNTTYKSFGAKPLPNRLHIIITRDKEKVLNDYLHKMALFAELKETDDIPWDTNVMYAVSLENALDLARNHNYVHQCDKEIFIIGGAQIFDLAKNLSTENMVQKLYITEVDVELGEGNFAKFQYDELLWKEVDRIENVSDEKNKYNHTFKTLDRVVNIIGI